VHVVELPGIGLLGAYRVRTVARPSAVPGVVVQPVFIVAEAPSALLAGSAGVLPLRLGQQSVLLTGLLAEPVAVGLGIVPADADDGVGVVLVHVGVAPARVLLLSYLFPDVGTIPLLRLGDIARRLDEAPKLADGDRVAADGVVA
jgi:hypothetical protein